MQLKDREAELLLYWRVVSDARHIRNADPHADLTEQQDDLDVIAIHSDWPRMKECAAAAAMSLAPPVEFDLSGFDVPAANAPDVGVR